MTERQIIIETTNRRSDCLESGGHCGRRIAYRLEDVAEVLGLPELETEVFLSTMTEEQRGLLTVPGTYCRLADYLHYHGYSGEIIDEGQRIR